MDRASFQARFLESAASSAEMACVHIGHSLGYYQALAKPRTPGQLAKVTETDARYAREWLEQQANAGYLACDDPSAPQEKRKYRLDPELAPVLADSDSTDFLVPLASLCVAATKPIDELERAFRTGMGVPYSRYGRAFVAGQGAQNRAMFLQQMKEWIPKLAVHSRLQESGRVADIGCGAAWSSIALAKAYPNVEVDGYDLDAASVRNARANVKEARLGDRVRIHRKDAAEASGTYDLVMAYECIHDLADPVAVLRTMRKMRGKGGTVLVMDENTGESLAKPGPFDRIYYGWSVLHCLPVGRAASASAATGTMMRTEVMEKYAKKAGFSAVKVVPIANDFFRFYELQG